MTRHPATPRATRRNRGIEPTRQQLDPAATAGVHAATKVFVIIGWAWAVARVAMSGLADTQPAVLAVGFLLLAAAGLFLIRASHPLRGPFTWRSHLAVHGLTFLAFAVCTAGSWGAGGPFADDWVPVTLGFFIMGMTAYRPYREIALFGTAAATIIAIVLGIELSTRYLDSPWLAVLVTGVSPLLALCYGSARYSRLIVQSIERADRRAEVASAALSDELREGISRSVHEDRVAILNRDVIPFFHGLTERNVVDDSDRDRALAIASSIRRVMVADADRSWLQALAERLGEHSLGGFEIDDTDYLADLVDQRQRSALRVLLTTLSDDQAASHVRIQLRREPTECVGILSAVVVAADHSVHTSYDPLLALSRIAFRSLAVEIDRSTMIVRFSFDHP